MAATEYPSGDVRIPAPVIGPGHDYRSITDKLVALVLTKNTPVAWFITAGLGFTLVMGLMIAITYLLFKGTGIWGNNIPVGWAFPIINFVWWIGIGHAGTLISAILLLFKQDWRTSINRFAEAMTLFAVLCAALFPLIHTGRPWLAAYWLFPYPNAMTIWPNFRSPLIWDVFAVSTYGLVSLIFWFTGLIPDLATFRDKSTHPTLKKVYGMLAMGWRGSARHWARYENAYLILAGLSTPLVLSVHTVVSFDFASAIIPGWHATIFPPYFVAGAIYAGFAMVLTLSIPLRKLYHLEDFITMRHIENMAKVMLVTGLVVVYGYACEAFFGWYSGNELERFMLKNRTYYGPYAWSVLAAPALQFHRAAAHVVQEAAQPHRRRLPGVHVHQRRHVARALRHHRDEPPPRLRALVVGDVSPDVLGLHDAGRHDRPVRHADFRLRAGAAAHLDFRNADAAARSPAEASC